MTITAGIAALFFLMILFFWIGRWNDFRLQDQYLEKISAMAPQKINEQSIASFPLNSDVRYNQIQVVATHNSYHKSPDRLRWLMIALVEGAKEADTMLYEHRPLTDQLNSGVRSFELDVRRRKDAFEITHVPLVDDRATAPDFKKALREINNWSESHPRHIPITIMLELKQDWTILDPTLQNYDKKVIADLEQTIGSIFKDKLVTPDDVRGNAATLEKAVLTKGWPRVKDILGKVVVVLLNIEKGDKPQVQYESYAENNPSLKGRLMFICSEPGTESAAFIKRDKANIKEFHSMIKRNYIIRSRIDKHLIADKKLRETAISSGAQHLATDFPPGEPDEKTGFEFFFKNKKTVRVSPLFKK